MNAIALLRGVAATIALAAGVFACGVRFGPVIAPEQHEAAMMTLAAVLGEDLGPVANVAQTVRVAYQ